MQGKEVGRMKAEELNKAIVNKVESILNNTDYIVKMHIGIFGDAGEVPVIRYSIEENIKPVGRGDKA